ncbi:hypothetical protein KKF11_00670, partial [Patescibacteria group bacterium]|nr:hypothetical protein [Patescibacteria group bacterium]
MSLPKITSKAIKEYQEYLKGLELSQSTIKRKVFALRKFCCFLEAEKFIPKNPFSSLEKTSFPKNNLFGKIQRLTPQPIHSAYKAYSSLAITKYINTAILIVFSVGLGIGLYNQLTGPKAELASAYPTSLTRPKRYLSFQGRLTDTSGNPISVITDFKFDLYNVSVGGTGLWTGSCSITPDQDGIFSTKLGSDCGSEIDSSVFTENQEIWLEITVGTSPNDETLDPRIQIATVGYALNAEALQGYPPATPATANTIPVIDNSGNLVIGSASPTIQSTSGTFAIEGAVGLILQTASGSDGNITLAPDGDGLLNITLSSGTGHAINTTNSNIGASGGKEANTLYYGYVGNDNTNYNLLKLESGSSKDAKFTVDNAGNASAAGILKMLGAGDNYFAG